MATKRCTLGNGACGGERICGDSCCDAKCKTKHGLSNTQGYCNRIDSQNLCFCEFDC